MRTALYGALFSVFVIAGLIAFRDHALAMWNAPGEVTQLSEEYQEAYTQTASYIEHQKEFNVEQRVTNELQQARWEEYLRNQEVNRQVLLRLLDK